MYYKISLEPLPEVEEIYGVIRKTIWRCADKRNIIVFMKDGSCLFTVEGKDIKLNRGEALIIPASVPYIRRPYEDSPAEIFYIHFTTAVPVEKVSNQEMRDDLSSTAGLLSGKDIASKGDKSLFRQYVYFPVKLEFNDAYDRVMSDLIFIQNERLENSGSYGRLSCSLSFARLLFDLSRTAVKKIDTVKFENNTIYPLPLQKSLNYIQMNYKQKITIENLSGAGGASQQHIIRLFRRYLGITPIAYINRAKVLHAIEILRNSEMSIKEISYELGFENPNYFSRMFKKEEKMSPSDTRRRIRNYKESAGTD